MAATAATAGKVIERMLAIFAKVWRDCHGEDFPYGESFPYGVPSPFIRVTRASADERSA
jgi:hypothetical protein